MKVALIATLYNEADNVSRWWDCLMRQTVSPDEIVVVDGGSTDGTWEKLQVLVRPCPVLVKLDQRRCNIAAGRNRAIALTDAEIIAVTDAGSFPEPNWFGEIVKPLLKDETLDVTGGLNISMIENEFQRFLMQFQPPEDAGIIRGAIHPSSRNTAFRRSAWSAVGGYPEWLTLAGEDALFTHELNAIGKVFFLNPKAIVHWVVRDNAAAYLKLLYRNGYGAAEARLGSDYFRQRALIAIFPPLLLLSRFRFRHLKFRYLKNYSSARGWVDGWRRGRRPPPDWKRCDGVWLSPEAQNQLAKTKP